ELFDRHRVGWDVVSGPGAAGNIGQKNHFGMGLRLLPGLKRRQKENAGEDQIDETSETRQKHGPRPTNGPAIAAIHPDDVKQSQAENSDQDKYPNPVGIDFPAEESKCLFEPAKNKLDFLSGVRF